MSASNRILLFLLALFFFLPCFGQQNVSKTNYPDRYRLDLPKEWNRRKLITAITDILPQTIDQLKNRDFCTSGKAAYYVQLKIDSLSVTNVQTTPPTEIGSIPHYTFSFNYSFHGFLFVTDSLQKPVSMLLLISGTETMSYSKQFSMQPQNAIYSYTPVYDTSGRVVGRRIVEEAGAVNTYIPQLSPYSVLTQDFLLNICEKKIYEIRRMLKKINSN